MGNDVSFFSNVLYMASNVQMIIAVLLGALGGVFVGFLPAFGSPTAVALLLPLTFLMPTDVSMVMLAGIYFGANFGGAIPAILVNTPGTPPAFITAIDGYPLAVKGKAKEALFVSNFSSFVGCILGAVMFYFLANVVGKAALAFGPAETFALMVLGLACVAGLSKGSIWRSIIALAFGVAITTIGIDPLTTVPRYTFGKIGLYSGIPFVPAMIGLFGISEAILLLQKGKMFEGDKVEEEKALNTKANGPTLLERAKMLPTNIISSIVGFVVGSIPGAGATVAGMMSWNLARQRSKTPEKFGKGAIEGVAASESANNAASAGALVPMLSLGIPGSSTTAVMLAALMMHDILPGPLLIVEQPGLISYLTASYIIGGLAAFIVFQLSIPLFEKLMYIAKPIIAGLVFVLAVSGTYFLRNSLTDIYIVALFGIIGYLMKHFDFPVAPTVLGLVLGGGLESNLRLALKIGGVGELFTPIASFCLLLALIMLVLPTIRSRRTRNEESQVM